MVRGVDADWSFEERRRSLRFGCRHKVDLLQGEKKSITFVLDYSMGGLRLSKPGDVKVGERIKVSFPHPLPGFSISAVECEVVWKRKNTRSLEMLAGLKFVETKERMAKSWVAYFFQERGASSVDLVERRKSVRSPCKLTTAATSPGIQAVGELLNLSLGGGLVRLNRPGEVGDVWGLTVAGADGAPEFSCNAVVQSCDIGPDGMYLQRVKFQSTDPAATKLLSKSLLKLNRNFWTD